MIYWIPLPSGRLGIATRPRGGDWLVDDVQEWKRQGVDVVVSLLTPGEMHELALEQERDVFCATGVGFCAFPFPDRSVPPYRTTVNFVQGLARTIAEGQTVVVHCRQGIGRSGLIAAAILVMLGHTPTQALAHVEAARGRPIPDTIEQRMWVESLRRK